MDKVVGFVDEMMGQGRAALVHCQGGYGRTGTILACYLVSQGWEAEKAIAEVRNRRPSSIASQVQQTCVAEHAELLQRGERP